MYFVYYHSNIYILFTSIPLTETLDVPVDLLFTKNPNFKISKADTKKFPQFANLGKNFMFERKYFDQIDGVAMGPSLSPALANLFMGYYEQKWLQPFEECKVI